MISLPAPARKLLDFIMKTETKFARPRCYETIFGHNEGKLSRPLTAMTIDEVLAAQRNWPSKVWVKEHFGKTQASSAAGGPQFMRATLTELKRTLKLSGHEKFDGKLQDRLAMELLDRRGHDEFLAGEISRTAFGKRLARASFPVLASTKGAHRGGAKLDADNPAYGVNFARRNTAWNQACGQASRAPIGSRQLVVPMTSCVGSTIVRLSKASLSMRLTMW